MIDSLQARFENCKSKNSDRIIHPYNLQIKNNNDREKKMLFVANRFKQNKKLIKFLTKGYNLKTLFFLQPNVFYDYNLELLRNDIRKGLFNEGDSIIHDTAMLYNNLRNDKDYIDLSNLFKLYGKDKKALIDESHYNPAFNKFLAEQIALHIDLDQLKLFPYVFDESKSTGSPRTPLSKEKLK